MKTILAFLLLLCLIISPLFSQSNDLWVGAYLRADGHWKANTSATYPENLKTDWIDWNAFNYLIYANLTVDPATGTLKKMGYELTDTSIWAWRMTDAKIREAVDAAHMNGKPILISIISGFFP